LGTFATNEQTARSHGDHSRAGHRDRPLNGDIIVEREGQHESDHRHPRRNLDHPEAFDAVNPGTGPASRDHDEGLGVNAAAILGVPDEVERHLMQNRAKFDALREKARESHPLLYRKLEEMQEALP